MEESLVEGDFSTTGVQALKFGLNCSQNRSVIFGSAGARARLPDPIEIALSLTGTSETNALLRGVSKRESENLVLPYA